MLDFGLYRPDRARPGLWQNRGRQVDFLRLLVDAVTAASAGCAAGGLAGARRRAEDRRSRAANRRETGSPGTPGSRFSQEAADG